MNKARAQEKGKHISGASTRKEKFCLLCWLIGHRWTIRYTKDYIDKLPNGKKGWWQRTYAQSLLTCERCGAPNPEILTIGVAQQLTNCPNANGAKSAR